MKKILITLFILISSSFIAACGFHPRTGTAIPEPLHTLYIKSSRPYDPVVTGAKQMLKSLGIHLVDQPNLAHYTLSIDKIAFHDPIPRITTTSLAVTINYSMNATVQLLDNQGHSVSKPWVLSASRSQSQNPSQVYTPGSITMMKRSLQRDIISKLYYWLISDAVSKST